MRPGRVTLAKLFSLCHKLLEPKRQTSGDWGTESRRDLLSRGSRAESGRELKALRNNKLAGLPEVTTELVIEVARLFLFGRGCSFSGTSTR